MKANNIEYESILDNIFMNFKGYFNFFENVFYIDGSTFHKNQQRDNMQNIIYNFMFKIFVKNKIFG